MDGHLGKWATKEFIRAVWSVAMDCEMCDDDCTVAGHDDDDDDHDDERLRRCSGIDHLEKVLHWKERLEAVHVNTNSTINASFRSSILCILSLLPEYLIFPYVQS